MNVAGGYFLTKTVSRPDYMSADLLPARLLSLSHCICDFIPDLWAIEWTKVDEEERAAEALKFGVAVSQCRDVVAWTTERINSGAFGWPHVFFSVQDAREFANRFLQPDTGRLVGIALHGHFIDDFLSGESPAAGHGQPGIYTCVSRRLPVEPNGSELGWEILCYDHGGFHSWLCNGLEGEIAKMSGIRPGANGFLVEEGDALAAAQYCGRPEVAAEPGFWAPWLVMEYSLEG